MGKWGIFFVLLQFFLEVPAKLQLIWNTGVCMCLHKGGLSQQRSVNHGFWKPWSFFQWLTAYIISFIKGSLLLIFFKLKNSLSLSPNWEIRLGIENQVSFHFNSSLFWVYPTFSLEMIEPRGMAKFGFNRHGCLIPSPCESKLFTPCQIS